MPSETRTVSDGWLPVFVGSFGQLSSERLDQILAKFGVFREQRRYTCKVFRQVIGHANWGF